MIPLTRKCRICGKNIFVEKDRELGTFFYDVSCNGFYHKDCFTKSKKSQKRSWGDEQLDEYFKDAELKTSEKVDELLAQKRKQDKNRELAKIKQEEKKILFDFIRDTYAPVVVPTSFYAKVSQIIAGNYYKFRGSIPPLELYDMWVRAKPRLDKIIAGKQAKGDDMSKRWNYDLAVLLGQYPNYLKWKQSQERKEFESNVNQNLTQMLLKRNKVALNREDSQVELDLNSILDEI